MRPRAVSLLIAAPVTALLSGGCGISDPYQHSTASGSATTATSTERATAPVDPSERPAGIYPPGRLTTWAGRRFTMPQGSRTPEATLDRYAKLYSNWNARTLAQTERQLASISLGSARANALQAAASYGRDTILLRSDVANSGTVVSIAPALHTSGVWVIVTSERTTGQGDYAGLPAQLHVTYAQVTDTAHEYVVSRWSPQS
jgi:hypothetical protein